jgi:hypothetical protein
VQFDCAGEAHKATKHIRRKTRSPQPHLAPGSLAAEEVVALLGHPGNGVACLRIVAILLCVELPMMRSSGVVRLGEPSLVLFTV